MIIRPFFGSNPAAPTFLVVCAEVKTTKKIHAKSSNPAGATILWCFVFVKCDQKYTTFFAIFSLDANKKRAPEQSIDRSGAHFALFLPNFSHFCPKSIKNTHFVLVDKSAYFCGSPSWTRTNVQPTSCPALATNSTPCCLLYASRPLCASRQTMSVWLRCCAGSLVRFHIEQKKEIPNTWYLFDGSPSWTRTNDPAVNSRMLYRLSYRGI